MTVSFHRPGSRWSHVVNKGPVSTRGAPLRALFSQRYVTFMAEDGIVKVYPFGSLMSLSTFFTRAWSPGLYYDSVGVNVTSGLSPWISSFASWEKLVSLFLQPCCSFFLSKAPSSLIWPRFVPFRSPCLSSFFPASLPLSFYSLSVRDDSAVSSLIRTLFSLVFLYNVSFSFCLWCCLIPPPRW